MIIKYVFSVDVKYLIEIEHVRMGFPITHKQTKNTKYIPQGGASYFPCDKNQVNSFEKHSF